MSSKNPLIVIAGPTASGKTDIAIRLAKYFGGEIISADSMQVYKKYYIATAKPKTIEMQGIRHHLMDFLNPDEEFSVGKFVLLAKEKINEIYQRGNIPIIVGGTGLYITSLIDNVEFLDIKEDKTIRNKLKKELEQKGIESLYEALKRIDPQICEKIHANNQQRILRALEIYFQTGKTMTQQIDQSKKVQGDYNLCMILLNFYDRQKLYDRINKRVDTMIENGLLDEAKEFFSDNTSSTALQAIGYKELKPYIDGEISLINATENLKQATRRYAKRQLTWFNKDKRYNHIYIDQYEKTENLYKKFIKTVEDSKIL